MPDKACAWSNSQSNPIGTIKTEYSGGTATLTVARWRVIGHKPTPYGLQDHVELIESSSVTVQVVPIQVTTLNETCLPPASMQEEADGAGSERL